MRNMIIFAAVATLTLTGCGDGREQAEALRTQVDAAIEGRTLSEAVTSAVDMTAARAVAEGAAKQALGEAIPTAELTAAAAIIDEKALISGVDRAIDGQRIGDALKGAIDGVRTPPAATE